ncbi:MAG TPA: hypothetical protein VFW19_17040 [Allosphingosinicella sp.]|nr:hypothetical protein [Allosphingosinicella sp.]
MAPFEYLLLFASVILGLAVCELAIALNRLLGAWARVKWDWLAPLTALLVFLKLVTQWWTWHGAVSLAAGINFEMYLAVLVSAALLFMLAAAALPNAAGGEESVDLRAHYERVRRRFWIVFALHFVVTVGTGLWLQIAIRHGGTIPWFGWLVLLMVPVSISLAMVRNRVWHTIVLVTLCLLYLFQYWGQVLPS